MILAKRVVCLVLLPGILLAALGLAWAQSSKPGQASPPLSEADVLKLVELGVSDRVIVTKLEKTGIRFLAGAGAMDRLKKAGASAAVLAAVEKAGATKQATAPGKAITYPDVLKLVQLGIEEQEILGRLQQSPTVFTLDARQVDELKKAGASEKLLAALHAKRAGNPSGDITDFAIILDCSGSMMDRTREGPSKMDVAKQVVQDLIESIPAGRRVAFIVYGHKAQDKCEAVEVLRPLSELDAAGKSELKRVVGVLRPAGHTPIALALRVGGKELAKHDGNGGLILITDGMETCHGDPSAEAARLAGNPRLAFGVQVVGFDVDAKERRAVEAIAQAAARTGKGRFWNAHSAEELKKAVGKIEQAIAKGRALPPDPENVAVAEAAPAEPMGDELATLTGHSGAVGSVAFSRDGRRVLSASTDKTVRQWDLGTKKERDGEQIKFRILEKLVFSPDGLCFLSHGLNPVELWDVETRKERLSVGVSPHVHGMAFSGNGRRMIVGYSATLGNDLAGVWDLETGKRVQKFEGHKHLLELGCVALSADGKHAASADKKDGVRLWEVESGKELHLLPRPGVWSMAFSPDGKHLVTGEALEALVLWDVQTGKEVRRFEGHSNGIAGVAFSPDGRRLLSGSADKTVRLWDVASGKELHSFEGHTGAVLSVAFSSDGRRAASGSADQSVRVWNVATYSEKSR